MKPTSYLVVAVAPTGFIMPDRDTEDQAITKKPKHGFVSAEEYLRQQPLKSSILRLATNHCMSSKRTVRSMGDFSRAYHIRHSGNQSFDMMVAMLKASHKWSCDVESST